MIFVEGEGDHSVVELLLSRICQSPGGHYARGVTVIEAAGLGKVKHLVALAEMFGVRSFVVADKDGVRTRGGQRVLLQVLASRHSAPPEDVRQRMRTMADRSCPTVMKALAVQREINKALRPYGAFVMSSDLEGLLLDIYGTDNLVEALGPDEEGVMAEQFAEELAEADDARERLASWIGSKGWNGDAKTSGKLEPHLPRLLLERWFEDEEETPRALRPLERWLTRIVNDASPTPL
ncbi:MAG TPA: TOPRIM nucleotidyl transferase/hydrolase domain-containing protein [Baekduia sp.]|nr:TOPRIM nucleotidyl transferase/hydrolase domain-containing protein [Baekduia sp.]